MYLANAMLTVTPTDPTLPTFTSPTLINTMKGQIVYEFEANGLKVIKTYKR